VTDACNPSYSGGRDQFVRPCLEKPITKKRAGGVAQGAGPEFKTPVPPKK
jgi:hypothetical protein